VPVAGLATEPELWEEVSSGLVVAAPAYSDTSAATASEPVRVTLTVTTPPVTLGAYQISAFKPPTFKPFALLHVPPPEMDETVADTLPTQATSRFRTPVPAVSVTSIEDSETP